MSTIPITIAPNMIRRAIESQDVKGLEVSDDGKVTVDIENKPEALQSLIDLMMVRHLEIDMVIPSNVARLKRVLEDMRMLEPIRFPAPRHEEAHELIEECVSSLDSVITNLDGMGHR